MIIFMLSLVEKYCIDVVPNITPFLGFWRQLKDFVTGFESLKSRLLADMKLVDLPVAI